MAFKYTVKKGDEYNKIANTLGFRNYKDLGGSAPESGDFNALRIGENLSFENYDPNKIQSLPEENPLVVSSKDQAQSFLENKNKLDRVAGEEETSIGGKITDQQLLQQQEDKQLAPTPEPSTEIDKALAGDNLYNIARADDQAKIQGFSEQMRSDKDDYLSNLNTRLANVDATARSAIDRISVLAEKRIKEQERINSINTDRVKAYGLGGSGLYQPTMFSDAVTERERKGAEVISQFEAERDTAINQALALANSGKNELLGEKLDDIAKIEDKLRKQLANVEKETKTQYDFLRKVRKEKEVERTAKVKQVQDQLKAFIQLNKEDYEDMSPEETEKQVMDIVKKYGLSFSEAYNTIQEGLSAGVEEGLKTQKAEAEIAKLKAQTRTESQKAKTEISKQSKNYRSGSEEESISKKLPLDFESEEEAKKERVKFVKEHGTAGAKVWDEAYKDLEKNITKYPIKDNTEKERSASGSAKIGDTVTIQGKKYKKIGEDDFQEI